MSNLVGGVVGLIILVILGWWVYNQFFKIDYSKPWWKGTATQEVCDAFDGSKCYLLSVDSDGVDITRVYFPNGGYITPVSTSCAERYGGGEFCTFFEANGKEWDVLPLPK